METKQLRILLAIVDNGGFTRAGLRLGLSQSAISHQISALERDLGVELLARGASGAAPTPAGDLLVQYARQIVAKLDEARRIVVERDVAGSASLRIAASSAICEHVLPAAVKELHTRLPNLELHLGSDRTARSLERLTAGEIDAAIVLSPPEGAKLRLVDLGHDELVAVAHPEHRWSGRTRIQASDFADERVLAHDRLGGGFAALETFLLEAGVFPRVAMEVEAAGAIGRLVGAGLGVSVLPRWTIRREIEHGIVIALPIGRGIGRRWSLASRDEAFAPRALRAFMHVCREIVPPLLGA